MSIVKTSEQASHCDCRYSSPSALPRVRSVADEHVEHHDHRQLVVDMALKLASTHGRDLDLLPKELFWGLFDMSVDGYETARAAYAWLGSPDGRRPPPVAPPNLPGRVCFRHGRFWLSADAHRAEDQRVKQRLTALQAVVLGGAA